MKTYEYVRSIADYYAYWDFVEVNEIDVDYEATAHAVWRWLGKHNILNIVRKFQNQEMRHDYLHFSIGVYFSLFEPIEKVICEWCSND